MRQNAKLRDQIARAGDKVCSHLSARPFIAKQRSVQLLTRHTAFGLRARTCFVCGVLPPALCTALRNTSAASCTHCLFLRACGFLIPLPHHLHTCSHAEPWHCRAGGAASGAGASSITNSLCFVPAAAATPASATTHATGTVPSTL